MASLLQQGPTQASCLQSRLASLRVLRRYWAAGDVKAMVGQLAYLDDLSRALSPYHPNPNPNQVGQLAYLDDLSLLVDLLHAGAVLHPLLDLEGALLLLPQTLTLTLTLP